MLTGHQSTPYTMGQATLTLPAVALAMFLALEVVGIASEALELQLTTLGRDGIVVPDEGVH